jgi:hypothetical protein
MKKNCNHNYFMLNTSKLWNWDQNLKKSFN